MTESSRPLPEAERDAAFDNAVFDDAGALWTEKGNLFPDPAA